MALGIFAQCAANFRNVCAFGSVLHGQDRDGCDLDLLFLQALRIRASILVGVPSGLVWSYTMRPSQPSTRITVSASSRIVTSEPVPMLIDQRPVKAALHQEYAGVGQVVHIQKLAPGLAFRWLHFANSAAATTTATPALPHSDEERDCATPAFGDILCHAKFGASQWPCLHKSASPHTPSATMILLDPKNDYIFKRLFATAPHLLSALINAVRHEEEPVEVIEVLNPRIEPEELAGKFIVLDVLARDRQGQLSLVFTCSISTFSRRRSKCSRRTGVLSCATAGNLPPDLVRN